MLLPPIVAGSFVMPSYAAMANLSCTWQPQPTAENVGMLKGNIMDLLELCIIIDRAYQSALRHLGHPPQDALWFRHLVAEAVLDRQRLARQLAPEPTPPVDH